MKDVLALKKASPALQLSLQLTRAALGVVFNNLTDDSFRELLLGSPHEILLHAKAIEVDAVSDAAYEQICRISEDADYDPGLAARESEAGFFLDLDTLVTRLKRELEAAHRESRRLLPTSSFCVGVDGSRQSYVAFEATSRLRRQGAIAVVHVNEEQGAHSIQLPAIASDFIVDEFTTHATRLRLPRNRVAVESVSLDRPSASVATQLLDTSAARGADFVVLGTVGKGGPAVDQLGHVPRDVLRFAPLPVLLVPPAPIHARPARAATFVVAVDGASSVAARCLHATLKLMRPSDRVRVVHFYRQPVVGAYDAQRFGHCHAFLAAARLDGAVEICAMDAACNVTESLHEYVATHAAAYLVLGMNGDGSAVAADDSQRGKREADKEASSLANQIGRVAAAMLFSPRCALCLCP